jgi:hypothetical protein
VVLRGPPHSDIREGRLDDVFAANIWAVRRATLTTYLVPEQFFAKRSSPAV